MCIETCIPCGPRQAFIVLKWNVPTGFRVLVPFSKAEIDYIDDMLILARSDEEIVRLDIPVKESILMDKFYPLQLHKWVIRQDIYHLDGQHEDGFQSELPTAILKQVFK